MVFVLDNYDSFTYNLVQYLGEMGQEVVVRRNDQVSVTDIEAMSPERILISPGPCTPEDAGISIQLIKFCRKGAVAGSVFGAPGDGGCLWRRCRTGQEPDAWQDEYGRARWADDLQTRAVPDAGDAISLADCEGRDVTERAGSKRLHEGCRRESGNYGTATSAISP